MTITKIMQIKETWEKWLEKFPKLKNNKGRLLCQKALEAGYKAGYAAGKKDECDHWVNHWMELKAREKRMEQRKEYR